MTNKLTNKDIKYFNVAREISYLATFLKNKTFFRIGAVVVLRNEIIATGYNRRKSHPLQSYYARLAGRSEAIWLHAELSCLIKLIGRDLTGAKIYIFRDTGMTHSLANSTPCEICQLALKDFGIKEIHYTTEAGYATLIN